MSQRKRRPHRAYYGTKNAYNQSLSVSDIKGLFTPSNENCSLRWHTVFWCSLHTKIIPSFELCLSKCFLTMTSIVICWFGWSQPSIGKNIQKSLWVFHWDLIHSAFAPLWSLGFSEHDMLWCLMHLYILQPQRRMCTIICEPCFLQCQTSLFLCFRFCCKIAKGGFCVGVFSSIHLGS